MPKGIDVFKIESDGAAALWRFAVETLQEANTCIQELGEAGDYLIFNQRTGEKVTLLFLDAEAATE